MPTAVLHWGGMFLIDCRAVACVGTKRGGRRGTGLGLPSSHCNEDLAVNRAGLGWLAGWLADTIPTQSYMKNENLWILHLPSM